MERSSLQSHPLTTRRFVLICGLLLLILLFVVSLSSLVVLGHDLDGFHFQLLELRKLWPLDTVNNDEAAAFLLARLPRVLLAVLVGAALSGVGVAYQSLLRNPLADPFVMGVSGGAALSGTVVLVAFGQGLSSSPALEAPAAFVGAILATAFIYRMGRVGGRVDATTLLLVGVVFNAFASALIMFLETVLSAQMTQVVLRYLMGSLEFHSDYSSLMLVAAGVMAGIGLLFSQTTAMNALALGDEGATQLGIHVERSKTIIFFAASLLVGLAVSMSGLVGFVGLIVPHLCRLILGPDHRLLLPASVICGAIFLVLADLGARLLYTPLTTEPPVGVVTALLGGPFFLLLLRKRYQKAFAS
jgi:iron complex transport system permease protein